MKLIPTQLLRQVLRAAVYSGLGATAVLIVVFVLYLNGRTDLDLWHLAELDEEFTADTDVTTFDEYLALEERVFRQIDDEVYAEVPEEQRTLTNRYNRGSLADPARWSQDWNRTFEWVGEGPCVLLLHGMSDSPYSLRHLGQRLNAGGAHVLGLRMPGHGTIPSGLVELTWQDMDAAVRLAVDHLAARCDGRPLNLIGYSTGAALAVLYGLETLADESLPRVERIVALSPAIGVASIAALAVWQARLGHLLGLDKLAWSDILPEYDPFKYGSFAVNAGDVVYRLTGEIRKRILALGKTGALEAFPPVLAFSSVVDATVSTPALVDGLFSKLPRGKHELVLFDINRRASIEPLMKANPGGVLQSLEADGDLPFTLSVVSNADPENREVVVRRQSSGGDSVEDTRLGLSWPADVYSLSHVALPFPEADGLYGGTPADEGTPLHLGNIALRGERGVLQVGAADMLRLRWNPFYPYVEERMLGFFGMDAPQIDKPFR